MQELTLQFYTEGFFGFGEEGDFVYWSPAHIIPIVLLLLAVILTYAFRKKIAACRFEKTIRLVLGCAMILFELGFFWWLLYTGPRNTENPDFMAHLPLQVCEWTCLFAVIMVLTENKHFFDIDVVVCLTCGVAPLFFPAVIHKTGPAYFRYYQFWGEHLLPIYCVFYMMFVKGFKYDIRKIYKPIVFLLVLGALCLVGNHFIPHADFMYLKGDALGPAITKMLPDNQYGRFGVYLVIVLILFALEFLVFFTIHKIKGRKDKPKESSGVLG